MAKPYFVGFLILGFSPSLWGVDPAVTPPAVPVKNLAAPSPSLTPPAPAASDLALEQGRALYDSGQYVASLDKFMKVLRRDPKHAEAREYLRRVVDQMRAQKKTLPGTPGDSAAPVPALPAGRAGAAQARMSIPVPMASQALEEEIQQRVRQRHLLTLDLAAIPGVKVNVDSNQARVEIETPLLFTDKTGGLKEEGIPILDRVAAWLKTFGPQPVSIHSYPEELTDTTLNGSLFLHRYAQLYGFFVEEKKLPATRFINTGLAKEGDKSPDKDVEPADVAVASDAARVIIVSFGGGALPGDEDPRSPSPKWLEFSILPTHMFLNPEEGDWTSLDLAALSRKGVGAWYFKLMPANGGKHPAALISLEGKGNLLKRVSWDGRDPKTGSFVPAGKYLCRLTATDASGASLTQEVNLEVKRSAEAAAPAVAAKPKPKPAQPKAKPKPEPPLTANGGTAIGATVQTDKPGAAWGLSPKVELPATPPAEVPKPAAPEAVPVAQAPEPESEETESDDSTQAIWKQVIQFDANESDLKPTLKASLERIGKTLEVYPLQKAHITGFAGESESNAAQLARQRADRIRETLINEYQVEPGRVIVAGGRVVNGQAMSKAEISITN